MPTTGMHVELDIADLERLQRDITYLMDSGEPAARKAAAKATTPLARAYRQASPQPDAGRNARRQARNPNAVSMRKGVGKRTLKGVTARPPRRNSKGFVTSRKARPVTAKAGYHVGRGKKGKRAYHVTPMLLPKNRRFTKAGAYRGRVRSSVAAGHKSRIAASVNAAIPVSRQVLAEEWTSELVLRWNEVSR